MSRRVRSRRDQNTVARSQFDTALKKGSLDRIVQLLERNPDLANRLDAQEVFDKIIRPREEKEFREVLDVLKQSADASEASSEARNIDAQRRMDLYGTAAGQALENTLRGESARDLAEQRAYAMADFQKGLNTPDRFDDYNRIQSAIGEGYRRKATGIQTGTSIAGSVLGVTGTIVGAIPGLQGVGAGIAAAGAGIAGAGGLAAQGLQAKGRKQMGQFGSQIAGVKTPSYGGRAMLPASARGFDVSAQGQGQAQSLFGRIANEDPYDSFVV